MCVCDIEIWQQRTQQFNYEHELYLQISEVFELQSWPNIDYTCIYYIIFLVYCSNLNETSNIPPLMNVALHVITL